MPPPGLREPVQRGVIANRLEELPPLRLGKLVGKFRWPDHRVEQGRGGEIGDREERMEVPSRISAASVLPLLIRDGVCGLLEQGMFIVSD